MNSDLLVYFLPTYGGLPPATWVAFQQRYHAVFRLPEAGANGAGKLAVLTLYDPAGSKRGDISQHVILHTLAGGARPVSHFEQIIPSNYGLNGLYSRLASHPAIQARIATMGDRLVQALTVPAVRT